ncbi:unnamed protein product [Cyprideis torosa]|uniref:GPN-loop GTPase 3 n=1 Tax=Cyprideis torosa TaxID=163714 RepID=A0A7R8WMS0_9CRUS|nr:unnamed protein product [Cyprideis torosa]CAG0899771.1 unnamed protein product [Cyprideis torosa]
MVSPRTPGAVNTFSVQRGAVGGRPQFPQMDSDEEEGCLSLGIGRGASALRSPMVSPIGRGLAVLNQSAKGRALVDPGGPGLGRGSISPGRGNLGSLTKQDNDSRPGANSPKMNGAVCQRLFAMSHQRFPGVIDLDKLPHRWKSSASSSKKNQSGKTTSVSFCLDLLRQTDYEGYLCTLLVPIDVRPHVVAIRSFSGELSRVQDLTTDQNIARMRFAFWKDALEGIYSGRPPLDSPVIVALSKAVREKTLDRKLLFNLISSRMGLLDKRSFNSIQETEEYGIKAFGSMNELILECFNSESGGSKRNEDHAIIFSPRTEKEENNTTSSSTLSNSSSKRSSAALAKVDKSCCICLGKAQSLVILMRSLPGPLPSMLPLSLLAEYKISQESLRKKKSTDGTRSMVRELTNRAKGNLQLGLAMASKLPSEYRVGLLSALCLKDYLHRLESYMPRYGQLVMGPAGSGKSTYCATLQKHGEATYRSIHVVNLDPAAEEFSYNPSVDIRELIQVEDVMEDEELKLGPNGALVYCMEFLLENLDWLEDELNEVGEDEYFIFDCPGQIELYTHMAVMKRVVDALQSWNFRLSGVFLIDSNFMVEGSKFLSGSMAALSTMVNLELPHVNVLSKMDLLSHQGKQTLSSFLDPDCSELLTDPDNLPSNTSEVERWWTGKFQKLSHALGRLIEDFSLVQYLPLDITDEDNIAEVLLAIDMIIQYGEDADVKVKDFQDEETVECEKLD